jgi:predicted phosphodiesterase
MVRTLTLLLCVLLFQAEAQQSQKSFHLYLIGDAGEPGVKNASYKKFLQQQLSTDSIPSAIVFLGDNIYPHGMPDKKDQDRKNAEDVLLAELDLANGFQGTIFFVPGNHDWKRGKKDGFQYILNQQAWIDSLHNNKIQTEPKNGCPGPFEISLNENLVLVLINTQWWLHKKEKPEGKASTCTCKTSAEVIVQLDDILKRNRNRQVVLAGHHPALSYGEHGGVYTWKDHIFPLTDLNKSLYLPLPIVGSIYPLYRKIFGSSQDLAHPHYKQFSNGLMNLLKKYPGVIYATGHDHSLQYIVKDEVHYIVSGAGSKVSQVKKKGYSQYAASQLGYVRLTVNQMGNSTLQYITVDHIAFEKTIDSFAKPR